MKVGRWSTTAGNNNGTPPDGFPEGQVTSSFNDGMREIMAAVKTALQDIDYLDHALTPTYVNANSFTLVGDQTARLNANRQLKLFVGGSIIYRAVQTASFTAVTTVQLQSGTAINSSLSSFAIGVLNPARFSYPPAGAYVTFFYIAGVVSIGQSYNVASVSLSATADVRITFTANTFASANYVPVIYSPIPGGTVVPVVQNYSATSTTCNFLLKDQNGVGQPVVTAAEVNCVFFGS